MNGWLSTGALVATIALSARPARAQDRRVDDEAVLAPLRARVGAGFGAAGLIRPGPAGTTLFNAGTGLNVEATVGLGRGFEVAVRIGARLDDVGRGLRADEVARGFETETFGTGISTLANPELRLRWRAVRWQWLEAGLDERFVLPTGSDPNVTEVFGAWMSAHAPGLARADVGLDGAFTWQSFSTGYEVLPALGIPVRLWFTLSGGLFAGAVVTSRYDVATRYTSSYLQTTTGAVAGYRREPCDVTLGAYLLDFLNNGIDRNGVGLGLSCRFGRRRG